MTTKKFVIQSEQSERGNLIIIKRPLCAKGAPDFVGWGIVFYSIHESTTKSAQATVKSRAAGLRLVVEKGASQTINDDCI